MVSLLVTKFLSKVSVLSSTFHLVSLKLVNLFIPMDMSSILFIYFF